MTFRNTFLTTLLFVAFVFSSITNAQTQQAKKRLQKPEEKTFFSIRKAFNDYWEPFNVTKDGYYIEDGIRKKAAGWKQFKRWEWYWDKRVDPTTGRFPNKHAADYFIEREKTAGSRSATGN